MKPHATVPRDPSGPAGMLALSLSHSSRATGVHNLDSVFLISLSSVSARCLIARDNTFGWVPFFLVTTIATIPVLALLLWIARREGRRSNESSPMPEFRTAEQ